MRKKGEEWRIYMKKEGDGRREMEEGKGGRRKGRRKGRIKEARTLLRGFNLYYSEQL